MIHREKSRGAVSNRAGRFARQSSEEVHDDWAEELDALPKLATVVRAEAARSIISRNQSPDVPFEQSINPYRGCEHGCVYCLSGDTPILFTNGRHKPLKEVKVGDKIVGTIRDGWCRRYVKTRVLDHWSTIKPAYRITLADGTRLVASADHRFLTERGWKFVTGQEQGHDRRPHLTTNNKLMGTGQFTEPPPETEDYQRGYLCGLIKGDGHVGSYSYNRPGRAHGDVHRFRLALIDREALLRAHGYLNEFGIQTREFEFKKAVDNTRAMHAIRTSVRLQVQRIQEIIDWPEDASDYWHKGFLAGIFDAEGHFGDNTLRISNSDTEIINHICKALRRFGFKHALEPIKRDNRKSLTVVRLRGGLAEQLRFFHLSDPVISRKRSVSGIAIKCDADLHVVSIEPLGRTMPMYDISTGTGDFIANGVISHNCFARPTHSYLDLSPGLDFETRLYYKQNAAELLEAELRKPGYVCKPITIGANTDPYQPIEREHRITRQLLETMLEYRHPVSLITKGSLIERDLDLLTELTRKDLVSVHVSVTSLDAKLKRDLEPRAASAGARLRMIERLAASGVPVGALIAPVIPALTDHELEAIVERVAAAGAKSAAYVLLRLPHEVSGLFVEWLETHYPDRARHVMSLVRQSRGGKDYDSTWGQRMRGSGRFADLIETRFRLACRRNGLDRGNKAALRTDLFSRPLRVGDQVALF